MASSTSLCEDLLIQILSLLPVADRCRCNAVSKDWQRRLVPSANSLRPTKIAVLLHLDRFLSPCMISLSDPRSLLSFCPAGLDSIYYPLIGVCNGMLLFRKEYRNVTFLPSARNAIVNYLVYNPVSAQVSTVVLPPRDHYSSFFFLVFDPRQSYHHFMIICCNFWGKDKRAYLYSSKTSEWRDLGLLRELFPCQRISDRSTHSYCLNGMAYKIMSDYDGGGNFRIRKNILVLEIVKERAYSITTPALPSAALTADYKWRQNLRSDTHHYRDILGEVDGHLGYAFYDDERFNLLTWVLIKSSSSGEDEWVLRYNVNLRLGADVAPPRWPHSVVSIAFHPGNSEIVLINFNCFLYSFNLKTKELQQVRIWPPAKEDEIINKGKYHLSRHAILYPFLFTLTMTQPSTTAEDGLIKCY